MNSNKLQQLRSSYRSQLRRDEIKKYQAQIRKLLINNLKHTIKQCPFCCNNQLTIHISHIISQQLSDIFNRAYVCPGHIELLFSKILQTIQSKPTNLQHLIYKDSDEQTEFYTRRVVLLLQLISNQILMKNEQIQLIIYTIFKTINGFGQILFDSAFGLNSTSFYQAEQQKINMKADVKRISFNTLLLIFYKYPLLLVDYFDDYPMVWLLRECNENKLLELYEIMGELFELAHIDEVYKQISIHAELCLREHIQESKTMKCSCEVEQKLFWLINHFLKYNPLPNQQLIFEILSLSRNKRPRFIKKISSRLVVLSQNMLQLDQSTKQLLNNTVSLVQHFYDGGCENEMEIE